MEVSKHKVVTISYTLKNDQGEVLDSSQGGEPLAYIQGIGQIIPGLENALEGKKSGDALNVKIEPTEGYGERNDALIQTVSKDLFQGVDEVKEGMQFHAQTDAGPQVVTVTAVAEGEVTIDANHPLAGENLHFEVEVLDVREASSEELDHGHVHGPDGHHH